jgi:Secreted Novel AID/APOBEC-like Deaminase 4
VIEELRDLLMKTEFDTSRKILKTYQPSLLHFASKDAQSDPLQFSSCYQPLSGFNFTGVSANASPEIGRQVIQRQKSAPALCQSLLQNAGPPPCNAVTQRRIDYCAASSTMQINASPVSNDDDMLEYLVEKFGEAKREFLAEHLRQEALRRRTLTPYQFYQAMLGIISSQVRVLPSSHMGRPRMPQEFQQVKDFAVTDGTMLMGSVGKISLPVIKNVKRGKHAERIFIDTVDELSDVDLSSNPQVTITINNSPCNKRCAGMLARWVTKHNLTHVTVFFANPHGFDEHTSEDEFLRARRQLRAAGIAVQAFEPRDHISEPYRSRLSRGRGRGWGQRYDGMKKRRDRARVLGRFDSDDESSGSDADDEFSDSDSDSDSSRRKRLRFASRRGAKSSSSSSSSSRSRSRSPVRRSSILGTLKNVDGSGMNCLIRAVLVAALGHASEDTVGLIRDHLVAQGVADNGRMLDLAGAAGAFMITFMVHNHILSGGRGITVYYPGRDGGVNHHIVIVGTNPIKLWLEDEHFQTID